MDGLANQRQDILDAGAEFHGRVQDSEREKGLGGRVSNQQEQQQGCQKQFWWRAKQSPVVGLSPVRVATWRALEVPWGVPTDNAQPFEP